MTWRFLPLSDPTVDIMVSRDLDSRYLYPCPILANEGLPRLTAREQAAVEEWLKSNLPFHSMRDNLHHGVEILGGMWGARLDMGTREKYGTAVRKLLKDVGRVSSANMFMLKAFLFRLLEVVGIKGWTSHC